MDDLKPSDLNILLVEPSNAQSKVIEHELSREGVHSIDFVSGKEEALERIDQLCPDLVISSLHFADGTGLDLLREIRGQEELEDLPFMLITSEARRDRLEEFKQSGVVAILPKPFTHENLSRAISSTLDLLTTQDLDLELYDPEELRVLVVDDSRLARKVILKVLGNLGITNMTEAADGSEAIQILGGESFDLVVTDYNMPEVNGVELTEFIRGSETHSHVPVLMVTSEANQTHLANVAQSGVNAMMDKPFEPESVRRLLATMMND
ncbi:response regulator [Pontibacterium sp.]|uniref:response regulator n=1 Tax=Pontibacterium sp. TaxID=2036026 RepID=UPI003561C71F